MKKLLVVLMAAVMVLSVAAVSMAANVKGDFRYDMYQDETGADGSDKSYSVTDLRFTVEGALSETLSATGVFQLKHDNSAGRGQSKSSFDMNEYYVTYKESWGGVKAGYYEYKFTPSRLLLKSGHYHVWPKVDIMAATTINLPVEGLSVDFLLQPYQQKQQDDGAYGVAVNYAADNFGFKVSYADFKAPAAKSLSTSDADLMAIDAYYNITDTMKVFVCAVDYSANDKKDKDVDGSVYQDNGIDGIDPVLGFSWDKIGGTNLFAGVEYAINKRYEKTPFEYNEYTVNIKYKFNNKTALEIEHYRDLDDNGKKADKTIYRLRYQF